MYGRILLIPVLALGIGACTRSERAEQPDRVEREDSVPRKAGRAAHEIAEETGKAARKAGREIREAAKEAREGWKEAAREDQERKPADPPR
jgi:hypothetical protein